jgi:hypothetical protein
MGMQITRGQLRRIVREEATRLQERGRPDFSDLADRTETFDQLVDAFQAAMDDTGEDFDSLVARVREDMGA